MGSGLVPVTFVADHSVSRAWLSIHSGHGVYGTWEHGTLKRLSSLNMLWGLVQDEPAGEVLMVIVVCFNLPITARCYTVWEPIPRNVTLASTNPRGHAHMDVSKWPERGTQEPCDPLL